MFGVFNSGNFVGFWANKKTDVWARITCEKLVLTQPEIYWYEVAHANCPEHYRFDENKNLVIQSLDAEGVLVDGQVYEAEPYSF